MYGTLAGFTVVELGSSPVARVAPSFDYRGEVIDWREIDETGKPFGKRYADERVAADAILARYLRKLIADVKTHGADECDSSFRGESCRSFCLCFGGEL
jgi:hypothetical protein